MSKKLIYFSKDPSIKQEEEENKTLEMRIELDSWSPVYKDIVGKRYREKIAIGAFDETINNKKKINSYLDHKISIEHLLASTANNTLIVEKENSTIYAKMKIDQSNPLHLKVMQLVEQGVIESNSFIFSNAEREIIESDSKDVDYEVVYKKGELISIDPVHSGFFPQDTCRVYSLDQNNIINEFEINNKGENMKQENQQEIQTTNNELLELSAKVDILMNGQKEMIEERKARNELLKTFATAKPENAVVNNDLSDKDFIELRHKITSAKTLTNDEKIKYYNKSLDYLSNEQKNEIKYIDSSVYEKLEKRALDATDDKKGLALIETVTMPGILQEVNSIFPEFTEYTQSVPLAGLDEIAKAVYIPDATPISAIREGQEATKFGGATFKVKMKPTRYAVELTQSNALSRGDEAWAAQIKNAKNGIWKALRKGLYSGLFTHSASAFNKDTYTGGFTKEAERQTQRKGAFTFDDIEIICKELISKYGDGALNEYLIATHPDTLENLERRWKADIVDARKTLYDPVARTYRGIPILISDDYPDSEIKEGKKVAAFFRKDALLAYGLTQTVSENIYSDMSKDQSHRYVQTRGEIKLIDPHVNSRFIVVSAKNTREE